MTSSTDYRVLHVVKKRTNNKVSQQCYEQLSGAGRGLEFWEYGHHYLALATPWRWWTMTSHDSSTSGSSREAIFTKRRWRPSNIYQTV